ncbi:MAG: lipoyl protein ligase domain-containing protein, partial [bacterium]
YAVVSNDDLLFPVRNIGRTYTLVADALARGLLALGIEVELARGKLSSLRHDAVSSARDTPCFVTPSRHELLCMNRKLVGSAQRRLRRSFLQHGSIPLTIDYDEMGRVLGFSGEMLRQNTISLTEAAGSPIDFNQAATALCSGFRKTLG